MRKVYFETPINGLTREQLMKIAGILEVQETTDKEEPGTDVSCDEFDYYIDEDYDVVITGID